MERKSSKIKFIDKHNCVVCQKPVFPFEGRIKVSDLDQQGKAAFDSLKDSTDLSRVQADSEVILCASCYRKLKQDSVELERQTVDVMAKESGDNRAQKGKGPEPETSSRPPRSPPGSPRQNPTAAHSSSKITEQGTKRSTTKLTKVKVTVPHEEKTSDSRADTVADPKDNNTGKNAPAGFLNFSMPTAVVAGMVAVMAIPVVGFAFEGMWAVLLAWVFILLIIFDVNSQGERRWHLWTAEQAGGESAVVQQNPGMDAAQAAAAAIVTGDSLAGTSTHALLQDGYWVTCGIEVENWTCFPLVRPHVQVNGGTLTLAPSNVSPATREVMVARKTSGLAAGSCGTVSWLIQPMNRRLVVMWSAPFNFNHHSNWLAVGLTGIGITDHAPGVAWFNQMYYRKSTKQLRFERGEYYADIRPVVCWDDDFEVEGIMASDHKAVVKVILRPLVLENFASRIKEKMNGP